MKKTYPVSTKARTISSWHKHLRPTEKRRAWKSTRKLSKKEIGQAVDDLDREAADRFWETI